MSYQITESVKNILKNFAAVNSSVMLRAGSTQKTISIAKSVLAVAEFDSPWPADTPVYQLSDLLANLSNYEKPTLEFEGTKFVIRGANSPSHVDYPYSDASVILAPPEKVFPTDNPHAVFTLPESAVKEIKKFSAVNSLPTLLIEMDGAKKTIVVRPTDDKNAASRSYSYPVHQDPARILELNTTEKITLKLVREHFDLIMDGGYTITLGPWTYVHFQHATEKLSYLIVQKAQ